MASTKAYLDFVLEQLSGLDEISSRAMMGSFILYYRGKVFGGIYDDRLLVKPVPVAVKMMPDAEMEPPYDGAKKMILVDDVDKRKLIESMIAEVHLHPKETWEEGKNPIKEIKYAFPVSKEVMDALRENVASVETVVGLHRKDM